MVESGLRRLSVFFVGSDEAFGELMGELKIDMLNEDEDEALKNSLVNTSSVRIATTLGG